MGILAFHHYKIWDEENDGANSGLDADKLDGMEATNFLTQAEASRFVEKSAATNIFSGELVAQTNVTVQGALIAFYIPPQGDLSMGSFTNGLPQ